jgi:hypothetical protein
VDAPGPALAAGIYAIGINRTFSDRAALGMYAPPGIDVIHGRIPMDSEIWGQ